MHIKKRLIISVLFLALALAGCATSATEETPQSLTYEQQSLGDFAEMLNASEEPDALEAFLDAHLETLDRPYIQAMVKAYATYLENRLPEPVSKLKMNLIDYDRILKYRDYLDKEYVSCMELYQVEEHSQALNCDPVLESAGTLLEQSIALEAHLLDYPDGETQSAVYELYVRYLYAAILNNGNMVNFKEHPEVVEAMEAFVSTHEETHTAAFVRYFLDELTASDFLMETERMQSFYFDFYTHLRSYLWQEEAPQS